ncbi:homoserine kinase [Metabacillus idriensis]|uniref:homoserine kinase n=1 Tax=Metabacillus idriensis TaxID=324768 RepID=UPI00174A501B|nr:homoserine kinase [Metabacillus idriensis]
MVKEGDMLKIKVPGSTANLGPGFDSVGLAVNRYLELSVTPSKKWTFVPLSHEMRGIPRNEENLIYQVAKRVASSYESSLPACTVEVWSDIPMARGLGSSAAAIVAGVELANELCSLQLSMKEKLHLASIIEGHPDNAGASLYGGLVVGLHQEQETELVAVHEVDVDLVVVVPPYELYTKDARDVLPGYLEYSGAVEASAVSNVLVAAVLQNNWALAGKMMQKDLFHQPYRGTLIKELSKVTEAAMVAGAYGAALSGAGPTVIAFAARGKGKTLAKLLKSQFPKCEVEELLPVLEGSNVYYEAGAGQVQDWIG